MPNDKLIAKVKENLQIEDDSRDLIISDVIQDALNYCNLTELPGELEPYIRKKVKGIIDYEADNGTTRLQHTMWMKKPRRRRFMACQTEIKRCCRLLGGQENECS